MIKLRIIEGRNPVIEALRSNAEIDTILISKDAAKGSLNKIIELAKEKDILIKNVDKATLDRLSENKRHQGVIAEAMEYEYKDIDDIFEYAKSKNEMPFIVILDEVTDVHNLGSIIRSAECLGAHGIVIPKRRAAQINGVAAKSSAGAVEYLPVCRVSNISQTLDLLKKRGLWIYGADMEGDKYIYEEKYDVPVGLVIGSEGSGIGRLVKEKCDVLIKIPMRGNITSLNASNAASIIIYEIMKQRTS
ncbi:MAG TPA: 23S rRNA (guanosine(2251)-2'-O)-methyltransferase RlmB [Sedimentibacter sp.]|jgi:23S rRNA (guanosine2251-2'-O)-methyltransferase|nr:23S rRNA (guanosine(2251)-2'-O)-methyltransferase RlmB [Sedimentibacter sp.]HHZ00080.1 23S rRNA (guanosine(2251)-2'-O)-methyltransferase RlmB [Tissierellia bacterium]HOK49567.1 23S rRNA (guanosine(2251)-2'-O)-methyltransferase RlmB [Sedimentibacter sp.]HOW23174.1 23S rRNA (guanosine(2251)-2'-O)-methyltransferase RlmB [Sedimentibacter sp.]HRC79835.1 23S rRNA (guanosine(2251)-2'-O)-methyltransferase RlmB [Sedimentibacter sp.]